MNMPLKYRTHEFYAPELDSGYSFACLDREAIFALGDAWERLSLNVIEENPYYSPLFLRAMLEHIEGECEIKALVVYNQGVLVGFLPFVVDKWHWLGAALVNKAFKHPFITLTIPLVDRQYPDRVVEALVIAMVEHGASGGFWLFDNFNLKGPVGLLFSDVFNAGDLSSKIFDEFDRTVLDHGPTFEQHMATCVSNKRRRDLKRNRKRLSKRGEVVMRSFTQGEELTGAVDDFLKMEAAGWKGKKGTALACHEATEVFSRNVFGTGDEKSITRADVLYLDARPIALSLAIHTGNTAFTMKCTYDEDYRTYSPGLLLEQDIIEDFLKTGWVERLDSATTVSGHVVQGLWNNSISVGDLLLCADETRSVEAFQHYANLEKLRRLFRQKLKTIVAKSRGD